MVEVPHPRFQVYNALDYRRWAHAQKQGTSRRMQVHRPINTRYVFWEKYISHLFLAFMQGVQFPTCKVVFHKDMIECV